MATTCISDKLWDAILSSKRCADALRRAHHDGRHDEAARRTAALCLMVDHVEWIARRERYGGTLPSDDTPQGA